MEINIGITAAKEIRFSLSGRWASSVGAIEPGRQMTTTCDGNGRISVDGIDCPEVTFTPLDGEATFEIADVMIGIEFHWERRERQRFEGALRLIPLPDGRVQAINRIDIEQYLKSVISSEMNGDSPLELLKAHAVISRSWLLAQIANKERHSESRSEMTETPDEIIRWYDREDHELFDVCADDHCQRYQGVTRATNPRVAQAVEATRGQVLRYDGKICDTRFSKCCGGRSELFESCWADDPHPYLVSVEDPWCDTTDRAVLSTVLNNYDCETPDFYRWTVEYSADRLSELVKRRSGIDFGRILDLVPVDRGPSGRITRLTIKGENKTMTIGKELIIRKWLSDSHLYSSAFDVETSEPDSEGRPGRFTLRGRGWGHGVGLCQIGAAVMASRGLPYTEILRHYFPLSQISSI